MKKYIARHKFIIAAAAFGLLFAVLLRMGFAARAVFNEQEGVHIDPALEENSTLIIGTHLIHLRALTEELYDIAQKSASESGQGEMYYKSELAGGAWYNISSAGSLSDIMESGRLAEDEEIHALPLTHRTGADGITHDLRTQQAVCIFDIEPLYSPQSMEELQPLKNQYDLMQQAEGGSERDKNNIALVQWFFTTETRTNETKLYDLQLEGLQKYYELVRAREGPEAEVVVKVMKKVDATRRNIVLGILKASLQQKEDILLEGLGEEEDDGSDSGSGSDDALLQAMEESRSNLDQGLEKSADDMPDMGTTIMSGLEYRLSSELITSAQAENFSRCDESAERLLHLSHIMSGTVSAAAEERSLLEQELVPPMDERYSSDLSRGVSTNYRNALQNGSAHAMLENIMKTDKMPLETDRSELQFYLQSLIERMDDAEKGAFIEKRMDKCSEFSSAVPEDEFAEASRGTVTEHLEWLTGLLKEQNGPNGGNADNALTALYAEKSGLQEERMEALDAEDLSRAKYLEAEIEAADRKINSENSRMEAELAALQAEKRKLEEAAAGGDDAAKIRGLELDKEIAVKNAGLAEGGNAENIQKMKEEASGIIREGVKTAENAESLNAGLDGLGALLESGSVLAGNALKDLYKEAAGQLFLTEDPGLQTCMDKMEKLLVENSDVLEKGTGSTLSRDTALKALEEALGGRLAAEDTGAGTGGATGGSEGAGAGGTTGGSGGAGSGGTTGGSGGAGSGGATEGSEGAGSGGATGGSGGAGSGGTTEGSEGAESGGTTEGSEGAGSGGTIEGSGEPGGSEEAGAGGASEESGSGQDGVILEGNQGDVTGEEPLGTQDAALAASALAEYAKQTDSSEIAGLAQGLAAEMAGREDAVVFERIKGLEGEPVPVDRLAGYLGCRYIWNDTKKTAVLSRRDFYYEFTAFKQEVHKNGEEDAAMDTPAQFHRVVYIPSGFVEKEFGCRVYVIEGTNYAFLAGEEDIRKIEELKDVLLEKGGG